LQCDPDLASVSHVFVDEVHERDLNTDFILIILKELLKRRPSLKLVLMSATLNAESFVRYFPGSATLSIPGRSHPVREYRLEDALQHTGFEVSENSDYAKKKSAGKGDGLTKKELRKLYPNYHSTVIDSLHAVDETVINFELLAQLLLYIVENEGDGAVLVFLPGIMEISKAMDEIRRIEKFQSSAFRIYPLHSSLSTADQVSVFEVPPEGVRKIVLASNIAETSITIEGAVLSWSVRAGNDAGFSHFLTLLRMFAFR
jgi:HrpA-like RNA helicase